MHTQGSRATRKLRSCLVAVGGGRKQSAATLQLQALEQPHPHVMGWTWSSGRVIWPNGLSIKDLLYLLILLVTYMILGPLAPWGPGGRTCRPPPRAGPANKCNKQICLCCSSHTESEMILLRPCLVPKNFLTVPVTLNLQTHV